MMLSFYVNLRLAFGWGWTSATGWSKEAFK